MSRLRPAIVLVLLANLVLPGAILWYVGHRRIGAVMVSASVVFLLSAPWFLEADRSSLEVYLFVGIATGLLGLALAARGDLREG